MNTKNTAQASDITLYKNLLHSAQPFTKLNDFVDVPLALPVMMPQWFSPQNNPCSSMHPPSHVICRATSESPRLRVAPLATSKVHPGKHCFTDYDLTIIYLACYSPLACNKSPDSVQKKQTIVFCKIQNIHSKRHSFLKNPEYSFKQNIHFF